jgi:hypothetical protein
MMNVKKKGKVLFLSFLMASGLFSAAWADTVLFPVIAVNQPNVITLVTVINEYPTSATHLKFTYRYKDTFVGGFPNHNGSCAAVSFLRPSAVNDLISFDASGSMNGGEAMFGDTNSYGGGFALGLSGPRRAYLLVTHADSSGNPVTTGQIYGIGGDAVIMDIAYGAAWGYRAVNDKNDEDYDFVNADDGGGVYSAMPSNGDTYRRVAFLPPDEWTTRFFVTPIGNDLDSANLSADIHLAGNYVYDRMGAKYTFASPSPQSVTCTAAIDLEDLIDSTTYSAIETTGGWGMFHVSGPGDVIAYKLEYVVDNATYGGTNNNGYLLSTYGLP